MVGRPRRRSPVFGAAGLERLFRDAQGARFHPMQQMQQSIHAGSLALGQPVDRIF